MTDVETLRRNIYPWIDQLASIAIGNETVLANLSEERYPNNDWDNLYAQLAPLVGAQGWEIILGSIGKVNQLLSEKFHCEEPRKIDFKTYYLHLKPDKKYDFTEEDLLILGLLLK